MTAQQKVLDETSLLAKILNLKDLVGYQSGAVVSRTLVKQPAGTITVFSFDKTQGLSEHTAPFDAVILILDGKVEVKIAGKPFRLKSGEMIIMPANKPHSLKAITKFKMMLVMIKK